MPALLFCRFAVEKHKNPTTLFCYYELGFGLRY